MATTTLSEYLAERSREICADNGCTEDQHNCESYAYVRHDGALLDICGADYFQGCSQPHAAIALPWDGTQEELDEEIAEQCTGDCVFTYHINLDERGSFFADVRDPSGETVYTIKAGNELAEGESSIFDDGFMEHKHDIAGLLAYLQDLQVLPNYAVLSRA